MGLRWLLARPLQNLIFVLSEAEFDEPSSEVLPKLRGANIVAHCSNEFAQCGGHSTTLSAREVVYYPIPNRRGPVFLLVEINLIGIWVDHSVRMMTSGVPLGTSF